MSCLFPTKTVLTSNKGHTFSIWIFLFEFAALPFQELVFDVQGISARKRMVKFVSTASSDDDISFRGLSLWKLKSLK
jgi:hypothetical protein